MSLLSRPEKRRLESHHRLKSFLEDTDDRAYFVGLITDYRENNQDRPELLLPELQVNYMRGCLEVLSDDLFGILVPILGDFTERENTYKEFYEMIAKYFIDVADGEIE